MCKKIALFLIICMLLTAFLPAYAQEERPALEKPESFTARIDEYGSIVLRLKHSDRIMQLINDGVDILCEFDWKINDGPWKFDSKWDGFNEQDLFGYYESQDARWVVQILGTFGHDSENVLDFWVYPHTIHLEEFDFQNNTYYDPNDPGVLERPTGIRSWFLPEDVIYKPAGTETMGGQVCTVLVGESEGEAVIRLWVSEETGLKLREDYALGPDAPRASIEYNYIIIDGPIDGSVFEIPPDLAIEKMD